MKIKLRLLIHYLLKDDHSILTITLGVFLMMISVTLSSQSAFIATGGVISGAGGSLTYSIGQVAYTSVKNITGSVGQGVQQPYEIFEITGTYQQGISLEVLAWPIPTAGLLWLRIQNSHFFPWSYLLFDQVGKLLEYESSTGIDATIDLHQYPAGIYFLKVSAGQQGIKTFKIIKN